MQMRPTLGRKWYSEKDGKTSRRFASLRVFIIHFPSWQGRVRPGTLRKLNLFSFYRFALQAGSLPEKEVQRSVRYDFETHVA